MKIGKDRVVAIEYTIRNEAGEVVDTSSGREPLVYLHGHRQIVPGVEGAIDGMEAGAAISIVLAPSEAYGDRDPNALVVLPRSAFPPDEELSAGTMFRAVRPDGQALLFSVVEVDDERVVVDANHPLAGQTLSIDVTVLSVREATPEELRHGHAHARPAAAAFDTSPLPA